MLLTITVDAHASQPKQSQAAVRCDTPARAARAVPYQHKARNYNTTNYRNQGCGSCKPATLGGDGGGKGGGGKGGGGEGGGGEGSREGDGAQAPG